VKLNGTQHKVISRLAGSSDGVILVTILESLVTELRDIRNLKERTPQAIDANLLAGEIIEKELISRLNKSQIGSDQEEDSYE
jgi:hypothetical protein